METLINMSLRQPSVQEIKKFEKLPDVRDVSKMAALIICTADDMGKLRKGRHADNRRVFSAEKSDLLFMDEDYQRITENYSGCISRSGYSRNRQWSMKIAERFWATEYAADEDIIKLVGQSCGRTHYNFRWNEGTVTEASKEVLVIADDKPQPETMDDAIFMPGLLHTMAESQKISHADFSHLYRNIYDFSRGVGANLATA